jgi:hypothetical protein
MYIQKNPEKIDFWKIEINNCGVSMTEIDLSLVGLEIANHLTKMKKMTYLYSFRFLF